MFQKNTRMRLSSFHSTAWNHSDIIYGCVLIFATVMLRLAFGWIVTDDAYITFRYADNLARGRGFVYNEGERVLGTTTPLFTILLAIPARLFGLDALPRVANVINIASDCVSAILMYLIGRKLWKRRFAGVAAGLLLALANDSTVLCTIGMEAPFFTMLLLGAFWGVMTGRQELAYGFAAFATLTRPEGLLMWLFILGVFYLQRQPIRWRALALAAVPVLTWVVFAFIYFGYVIPHSMRAKSVIYHQFEWWKDYWFWSLLRRLFFWPNAAGAYYYLSGFFTKDFSKHMLNVELAQSLPILLVVVCGVVELRRRGVKWLLAPVFFLTCLLGYAFADTFFFGWYIVPLVPFTLLTIMAGVRYLIRFAYESMRSLARWRWVRVGKVSAMGFAMLVLVEAQFWMGLNDTLRYDFLLPALWVCGYVPTAREGAYFEASRRIADRIEPGRDRVMTAEVGVIGYALPHARVYDVFGLVTPQVIKLFKQDRLLMNRISRFVLELMDPDFIICLEDWFPEYQSKWVSARYRILGRTRAGEWGSGNVWILERRRDAVSSSTMAKPLLAKREPSKQVAP